MNPVAKAAWFIESHFASELTLTEIAAIAGVSRFHMVRAFGLTTGHAVMRYVRGRRLSEAAKALANGAPDILTVALDAGYSSHEAFTRAFRDQFGLTPEMVRAQATVETLVLMEPLTMHPAPTTTIPEPRIETGPALLIAGLADRFTFENRAAIPALWQRFVEHLGHIPGQIANVTYGVCHTHDDAGAFDYLAGVAVSHFGALPKEFSRVRITEQRYAVFTHTEHVASVQATFAAIFSVWLPKSGFALADAPLFERYDHRFNPHTGAGGFEVWIPLKPTAIP